MRKSAAIIAALLLMVGAGSASAGPGAAATSRMKLVTGNYRPDAATTGVPAGTRLTPLGSFGRPLDITVDGTVIDGKDIYGDLRIQAKNVVIKNSYLHCGNYVPDGNSGCVDANDARVRHLTVQDCTIHPTYPSYYRDGIVGHDYHALRDHIWGTNDGLGIFNPAGISANANVDAEANYIHSTVYWDDDPTHTDGTHNDGIQVQGGRNILIWGNTVVDDGVIAPGRHGDPAKPGSPPHGHGDAILLQNNTGTALENTVVENNWLDDGLATIALDQPNEKVTVRNNRLGHNQYEYANGSRYPIRIYSTATDTVIGLNTNMWDAFSPPPGPAVTAPQPVLTRHPGGRDGRGRPPGS